MGPQRQVQSTFFNEFAVKRPKEQNLSSETSNTNIIMSHNIHAELDTAHASASEPAINAHTEVQREIKETVATVAAALHGDTLTTSHPVAGTTTTSFTEAFVAILKKNPLYPKASALFHWTDPARSGTVFGCITLAYFLVNFWGFTFLTLFSYAALILLIACIGYVNYIVLKAQYGQDRAVENPFKALFHQNQFQVSRQEAQPHLDTLLDLVNLFLSTIREIFFVTDNVRSFSALGFFFFTANFGNWFGDLTIIYLATLGLFVWPRLYQEKKNEIDQGYAKFQAEKDKYVQLALSKVPPALQQRLAFLKPKSA
ncbi:reticulon 4 [Planoprotostelium fungivorum]|uniref:Reticulon-like protein n=1 Tax=Planoprotostelium fungivorum TaxID=1890364 RepID=A0A2P6NZ19_9EUKA|nr:reticulon 4 [Planoprotostelium fungivorum]